MKFIDAYILASTKRKTRRIRTALVVIVSSLLFAVLFFAAFAGQGVFSTANQVKDVGFNGRHLITVFPAGGTGLDYKGENQKIEAQMSDELKKRGIKVTDQTKLDPSWQGESARRFNQVIIRDSQQVTTHLEQEVSAVVKPIALYHFRVLDLSATYQPDATVDTFVEQLKRQEAAGGSAGETKMGVYGPSNELQFFQVEQGLLQSQLQPGQTFAWQPGQPYPIVISYSYMEKLAKQSFNNVPAAEKNKAYRKLLQEYSGKELRYCFRNSTAQNQLAGVVHYNYVADHDKDAATKPIDIPLCGGFDQKQLKKLGIVSDPDSSAPKPLFPAPATVAPDTHQMTFKIVGFVPSQPDYGNPDVINQILTTSSALPAPNELAILPSEVVAQEKPLQPDSDTVIYGTLFAEFASRDQQKQVIASGCSGFECGGANNTKPFFAPFGSVSLALENILKTLGKFVLIGILAIMAIAAVMILFTISKVISDSTKEIAVFRSLGARRRDIAQIYYTFGLMLATASLVLAAGLAAVGAIVATSFLKERIANSFIQAVGAYNTDVHATLFAFNGLWLATIAAALVVASLIGISIPVAISLRRKLITILREE